MFYWLACCVLSVMTFSGGYPYPLIYFLVCVRRLFLQNHGSPFCSIAALCVYQLCVCVCVSLLLRSAKEQVVLSLLLCLCVYFLPDAGSGALTRQPWKWKCKRSVIHHPSPAAQCLEVSPPIAGQDHRKLPSVGAIVTEFVDVRWSWCAIWKRAKEKKTRMIQKESQEVWGWTQREGSEKHLEDKEH